MDDVEYQIVFTKALKLDYYERKLVSTYTYKIATDSLIATDKSDGSLYRYSILSLTKNNLTLLYVERGNLLKFKRRIRKK